MTDESGLVPKQGSIEPGGEVVVGAGERIYLPHPSTEVRWADAESNPDHQPLAVGPEAACSCGWTGSGWVSHLIEVTTT